MKILFMTLFSFVCLCVCSQKTISEKPRILVSTDIGGTDPDDNQSMIHLLMYSDRFEIEGLLSSPSYGKGSVDEIKKMISIYGKDYPVMKRHAAGLMAPEELNALCKQGSRRLAPFKGYDCPTEGSDWIIRQARKNTGRPLWILVWGTLEDVAQALHDAPDIKDKIRIYYIGGPNKKWGVNSYAYIAGNFPDLWMIENNSTYRGFITSHNGDRYNIGYYDYAIRGAGNMGADFINYYNGVVKMGDTPSLLYMMNGNPDNPCEDSWGGCFEKVRFTARRVFDRHLTLQDTVPVYSVIELLLKGPVTDIPKDSSCFTVTIDKQQWPGYYIGDGTYAFRYSPKAPARLTYTISSGLKMLDGQGGEFVVKDVWPGYPHTDNYQLGENWYSDKSDRDLFEDEWQGAKSVRIFRNAILDDWAERWSWLK